MPKELETNYSTEGAATTRAAVVGGTHKCDKFCFDIKGGTWDTLNEEKIEKFFGRKVVYALRGNDAMKLHNAARELSEDEKKDLWRKCADIAGT